MEKKRFSLDELGKTIEEEFDFDFSVNEKKIETVNDFADLIKTPFLSKDEQIFYRGERINSASRPLVPTIYRNRKALFNEGEAVKNIDAKFILDYYKKKNGYFDFYSSNFGFPSRYRLYELCAFSQHYLDVSPFVDFTKSLYVALSFALKGREVFDDDIVLYTVKISNKDFYTTDITTAECWLNDYKVTIYNTSENMKKVFAPEKISTIINSLETLSNSTKSASPQARFIDIPNNDLMKYQQGVFLLLTDFQLIYKSYQTKNIRNDFDITKYIISRDLCPDLVRMIRTEAPCYKYDNLLDIKKAMKEVCE